MEGSFEDDIKSIKHVLKTGDNVALFHAPAEAIGIFFSGTGAIGITKGEPKITHLSGKIMWTAKEGGDRMWHDYDPDHPLDEQKAAPTRIFRNPRSECLRELREETGITHDDPEYGWIESLVRAAEVSIVHTTKKTSNSYIIIFKVNMTEADRVRFNTAIARYPYREIRELVPGTWDVIDKQTIFKSEIPVPPVRTATNMLLKFNWAQLGPFLNAA